MNDDEDVSSMFHGPYKWKASTRNRWALYVADIHVAVVERSRSWKSMGQAKPWFVEIFGSRYVSGLSGDKNAFRTLDLARTAAEKELRQTIRIVHHALAQQIATNIIPDVLSMKERK